MVIAKSIAVLPFINMSSDPENEFFSDGVTEEIINALAKIKGLKVISRTSSFSFKNKNIDVRAIGTQLGVSLVLEGSVRKSKNRIRISTLLVNAIDGVQIWSKNFDRKLLNIFDLQDEVSLLIADQIRENFGHFEIQDHLVDAPTRNVDAYDLYLKARYHQLKWNAQDLLMAASLYEECIELDPDFSLPYFGAALCFGINASWGFISHSDGIQKANQYLKHGFILNSNHYLGLFARATVKFWGNWQFQDAHVDYIKSMELNPSLTDSEEGLAELYTFVGEFDKALKHTDNILSLNPLSPNHYYTKAIIYFLKREYNQSIITLKSALQIDPTFALASELSSLCYIKLNDIKGLNQLIDEHPELEYPEKAKALLRLLNEGTTLTSNGELTNGQLYSWSEASLIPWNLYFQTALGNHDIAMTILEKGVRQRKGQFINFKFDPFLEALHNDIRFKSLLESESEKEVKAINNVVLDVLPDSLNSDIDEQYDNELLEKLSTLLKEEQLYLNSNLSLKNLAEELNIHPNKLSALINTYVGKNFNEYINTYRLESFKEKALAASHSHLTLLGIAYESGFNSKTVFNSFFKRLEGMTPSKWVKLNRRIL